MSPRKIAEVRKLYASFLERKGIFAARCVRYIPKPSAQLFRLVLDGRHVSLFLAEIEMYRATFIRLGVEPCRMELTHHAGPGDQPMLRAHLRFICEEATGFACTDRYGKACRWLGFLKGASMAQTLGPAALVACRTVLAERMPGRTRYENRFWLGFVQGGLWATGCFSIAEMGEHNMPASRS